jgi:DNA segregation ATPase FtsK/SpoIIIE, S-DNA-T family
MKNEDDGLVEQAISIVRQTTARFCIHVQRRLRIGYPRAARLLDQLEDMGSGGTLPGRRQGA